MNRACFGPVRAAVGDGMTDAEIEALLDRVMAKLDTARIERGMAGRLRRAPLSPEQVRAIIARETVNGLRDGYLARRVKAYSELSRAARDEAFAAMPDKLQGKALDIAEKTRAYNAGSEKVGFNLGFSTEAESKGRFAKIMTPLDKAIEASGAKGMLDPLFNRQAREAFENKVAIEMARANGAQLPATGDTYAEAVGKAFAIALETGRQMQNKTGAWIDRLPGYIAKQNHDALKVAGGFWSFGEAAKAKAFQDWHDAIRPLLSEETFAELDLMEFEQAIIDRNGGDLRKAFLDVVWNNIVQGDRVGAVGADHEYEFRTPASKARAVSRGRSLHFKDPAAWLSYHRAYGQGSLYQVIIHQIEGAARNSALMNRWGPNPEAAFAAHIQRAIKDLREKVGPASVIVREKLEGKGSASLGGNLHDEWAILTGKAGAPEDARIAAIGNAIRIDQRLSKLGGAVLASLGPDQAIAAHTMRLHGGTWLQGYQGAFGGVLRLNRDVQKEVGDMLGAGARAAATDIAGRFDASDGVAGLGSALTNMMFKVTGFEAVMNGHKRGLAAMWSMEAAKSAERTFGALDPDFRGQLQRFGVTEADWNVLRQGVRHMSDGHSYLGFDHLSGDLDLKMRAYMQQFLDDSLTEPGIREQAKLTFGTKRGTPLGEAVRCFTQFKAFPLTYATRHFNPAIAAARAGDKGAGMNLAHLILASTLFGYASLQAKQLSKGLSPRPLWDEDGNWRADIWIASLLQGGGMGIYSDFLFGEYSRAGGVVETMAGPSVGEFANVAKLLSKLVRVDKYDDSTAGDLAADSVRVLKSNTPFLNTWYARWAIDTAIMHYVQDAISPGYSERYAKRLEDEQGVTPLLKPAA